jgi:hypothetical protein
MRSTIASPKQRVRTSGRPHESARAGGYRPAPC